MFKIQTAPLRKIMYLLILLICFPLFLDWLIMQPRLVKMMERQVTRSSSHIVNLLDTTLPFHRIEDMTAERIDALKQITSIWEQAFGVVRIDIYDKLDRRVFSTVPGDTGKTEPGVSKINGGEEGIAVEIFDTDIHEGHETLPGDRRYAEVKKAVSNDGLEEFVFELYFDVTEDFAALARIKQFYLTTLILAEAFFVLLAWFLIRKMDKAFQQRQVLAELLPICSACKKVRNDSGYWQHVEEYLHTQVLTEFTHGICPDCEKEFYPDISTTHPGN